MRPTYLMQADRIKSDGSENRPYLEEERAETATYELMRIGIRT